MKLALPFSLQPIEGISSPAQSQWGIFWFYTGFAVVLLHLNWTEEAKILLSCLVLACTIEVKILLWWSLNNNNQY